MVIEILLIISVVLQIVAAIVAIGLIRRTKYNLSWMLHGVYALGRIRPDHEPEDDPAPAA